MSKKEKGQSHSFNISEETHTTLSTIHHEMKKSARPLLDFNSPPKDDGYISEAQERQLVISQMMRIVLPKFF